MSQSDLRSLDTSKLLALSQEVAAILFERHAGTEITLKSSTGKATAHLLPPWLYDMLQEQSIRAGIWECQQTDEETLERMGKLLDEEMKRFSA